MKRSIVLHANYNCITIAKKVSFKYYQNKQKMVKM